MEKYLWARWTVIIITWIVTSFACHQLGKIFLQRSASVLTAYQLDNEPTLFMLATFLTIVQMMSCVLLASSNRHHSKDTDYSETPSAAYRIAIAGHILCTLLTNWSLTRMDVATMLTLKMAEPIYTAIALRWCTDERLGCAMWWSVLLVVGDALFFTLDGTQIQEMTTLGLVLVMMSNEVVALRNLAIKQLHISGVAVPMVQWHRFYLLAFMMAVAFFFLDALEFRCYVPKDSAVTMAVLGLSSIFHVIYSIISTWVMLHALGMMSHALACVGKRVLVVNLFYRQRTMTRDLLIMLVGLCLALFVRARLALQSGTDHHTETTSKEKVVETEECKTIQCYVIQLPEENWHSVCQVPATSMRSIERSPDQAMANQIPLQMHKTQSLHYASLLTKPMRKLASHHGQLRNQARKKKTIQGTQASGLVPLKETLCDLTVG